MTNSILSEMVAELIRIISREAVVFEDYLGLLQRQQEMLAKKDIDALSKIRVLQCEKVVESQILNDNREKLAAEIKSANAIEGDLNVSLLLDLVDENQGSRLIQLRNIINGLNTKIGEVCNQNAMLLNRSREYITKTMELLSKINNPDSGYSKNGATVGNGSSVAVNRRA